VAQSESGTICGDPRQEIRGDPWLNKEGCIRPVRGP
jgi:hypothetical protein